jgi:hypothetical protein
MRNLEAKAWLALAVLTVVMAFLVFVPAGTVHYWQAWVYLAIFAGVSALTTLDLIRTDQALLERRMRGGPTAEKQPTQKVIMLVCLSASLRSLLFPPWITASDGRPCLWAGWWRGIYSSRWASI